MSDYLGPESGIFCIFIVDIFLRSALVGFSLLCAIGYYYKKGPVLVDYVMILMTHGRSFCITLLQLILLLWDINVIFFFLRDRSEKWISCSIHFLTSTKFAFLSFFTVKYILSIFLTNFESVIYFYFLSQLFKAVKEFPKFCF